MSAFYNVDQPPFNSRSTARAIAAANNGLLFDIGDMSTMFQDAAGTTPVTAVEQPVGLILDKSGNGNHATQPVTASRPTLSARKNIMLATETLATQSVTSFAAQYTLSFTGPGSVTLSGTATGTLSGTGADNRVSLTVTPTAGTLTLTVSGSVTKAQLELGAVAGPYQRVNTATDYDTNPALFPKYLKFDGIDDYLNLPYMGLYAGGAASSIMARDMILNPTQMSFITEASSTSASALYYHDSQLRNALSEGVYAQTDAGAVILFDLSPIGESVSPLMIKSIIVDVSSFKKYRNSFLLKSGNYTRSGTLSLNTTTIGAVSKITTTGNYASMKLYGLIITKSALTDAQRIKCERFLAQKSGVML